MPDWIAKYWIEWIFGIFCAVLAGLYKNLSARLKKQKQEQEATHVLLKALAQCQIVRDCEECIKDGYCTLERKRSIESMYQAYHTLGGNGAVAKSYNSMMDLPTSRPESAAAKGNG
ncbi:MAG: hypothetical protein IKL85_07550 [Lentisphaeria bacterium]|nr:hypothetical protein [Lentisphaeria bacterium]